MYPGCRFMDFHPRETDRMSYAPHVPPQMKIPVNYESFPCYGSYVCPYPLPYQGCYHNQVPDYHTYGLRFPHYIPPPPVHCHGSYPPLPGSYPFHYLPSPHYSAADPRYEYDKKGLADHHCCGCPNHQCQQKENKNVKIGEQTFDDERDSDASLIPVGCMPRNSEQMGKVELKDGDQKSIWEPSQYGIFPLKFIENQDKKSKPEGDTENSENSSSEDGPKTGAKNVVKKIIPVKQINQSEEKNRAPKVEKNHSEMALKHTDKKGEKKHLENNSNVQSSLSKASKLPPVCLRVDPLPSRRTKSGSTRSPSPPANKKKSSVDASAADSEEKVSSGCHDGKGGDSDQEFSGDKGVKNVNKLSGEVTKDEKLTFEGQSGDVKGETGANGGPIDTKESGQENTNAASYKKFSEAEAAAIIQSAYRGFGVRRWEPLKKLKEIARIEGELIKVRLDVQNLVSSGSGNIDKQRILIGETIMNHLLKLDTIQGLHPSIRNIRKSVAKELVSLQEKLDSITFQNSDELKESDESKHAEEISKRAGEEEREQAGEDRHEQDTTSPSHVKSDTIELCQDKPHTAMDTNISSGVCEDHDPFRVELKELPPPPPIAAEEEPNPVVQLQDPFSLVDSDWSSREDEGTEVNTEVPPRVPEQNSDAQVFGEGLQIDGGRCIVKPGKLEDHDSILVESKELPPSVIVEEKPNHVVELQNPSPLVESDWSIKEDEVTKVNTEVPPRVPGKLELVQESGLISLDNEAKETSAEEQQPKKLLTESPNLSAPEGDDKPVDDMQTADNVGAEAKEMPDIKAAANVCQVEGDDKPVDDMQTVDTVGIEQRDAPEVNEFEKDVRPVENLEFIETRGTELEDLSMAASDLQVKQQKASFVKDTVSGEEVHMEETANCNIEQKMAMDEDQEMWEDKFDNKEIYRKHSDGSMFELGTEKVKKQPHREFASGEEDMAGEELVGEQLQKEVPASLPMLGQISSVTETESDKKLVKENEKLKESVEKLIAAGKEQLTAISSLSERVKDLEKKLSRKKKLKMRRHKYPSQYLVQV